MNYDTIKSLLFRLSPEAAHHVAETAFELVGFCEPCLNALKKRFLIEDERLRQDLFGRTFPNPVGLAAGFDKNATMTKTLHALGFGYVEVGTITPKPQIGNPKPRLFRYPKYEAIQNAMGFNNDGAEVIAARLSRIYPASFPIGANIGKNKTTPEEKAIEDYRYLIEKFHPISDYLVINISSPNTPGLRDLQNEAFIKELFNMAKEITAKPILLKIAPDMSESQAVALTSQAVEAGADGIIATNTSIDYSLLPRSKDFGGISGKVIKEKSFAIFDAIAKELYGKTTLISVGGIDSAQEAYRRIRAGASLVQIYTAFIYGGPPLIRQINEGLLELLQKDGLSHIGQAVGADR